MVGIINHHLAHAASTFYASGFNNSAVLIVDGNGSDLETTTYYSAEKFKINFPQLCSKLWVAAYLFKNGQY